MKKQIPTILTLASVIIFVSCGPSAEEVAAASANDLAASVREKAKMDSVALGATNALLGQQAAAAAAEEAAIEAEIQENNRLMDEAILHEDCKEMRTMLAVAEDNLEEIKKFQLLRTPAEKEQELTQQYRHIEELKDALKKCD
jgi:hypothetical protein